MQLLTFTKEDTVAILSKLNIKTEEIGKFKIILDENGQPAKCEVCERELSTENLGNIAKGSNKLFCDNPACFATHLAKKFY